MAMTDSQIQNVRHLIGDTMPPYLIQPYRVEVHFTASGGDEAETAYHCMREIITGLKVGTVKCPERFKDVKEAVGALSEVLDDLADAAGIYGGVIAVNLWDTNLDTQETDEE